MSMSDVSDDDDSFDLYDSIGEKDEFDDYSFTQNFFSTPKTKKEEAKVVEPPKETEPVRIPEKKEKEVVAPVSRSRNASPNRNDERAHGVDHSRTDTRPYRSQETTVVLDNLPWWTTDTQVESILADLGVKWQDMKFSDTKNGKIGTVTIQFATHSAAAATKDYFSRNTKMVLNVKQRLLILQVDLQHTDNLQAGEKKDNHKIALTTGLRNLIGGVQMILVADHILLLEAVLLPGTDRVPLQNHRIILLNQVRVTRIG
eukprot:CAMPEP_0117050692 /NCGR_PEP_ID=MMETSP0472-20121206/35001_1 /TAXON_ID=693140 ORGANISM="Tiarina fusus, Strain LIS" /NCGR_SAMPLE_ID=MMETSP0472 /ASSEMBLY_ACC=CAM_ASM_000603 /LENGTH=257 /DNA_ID=CAMNT_0004764573 /DNA_START=20 /DNA_END=791 /DNA_ORIENTATION=-